MRIVRLAAVLSPSSSPEHDPMKLRCSQLFPLLAATTAFLACGPETGGGADVGPDSSTTRPSGSSSDDDGSLSGGSSPSISTDDSESTSGFGTLESIVEGDIESARLGDTLSIRRDFDGDGLRDVFVSSGGDLRGFIVESPVPPIALLSDLSLGVGGWSLMASGLSPLGDLNGDGRDDLASSARVYFFDPDADLGAQPGFALEWGAECPPLAGALSSAGDFNGDARSDVIVGVACGVSFPPEGGAFVVFGRAATDAFDASSPSGEGVAIHAPEGSLDLFGRSVTGVGDVDGDGFDDVAIGSELGTYFVRGGASAETRNVDDALASGDAGLLAGASPVDVEGQLDYDGDGRPDAVAADVDGIHVIFSGDALFAGVLDVQALVASEQATTIRHPPLLPRLRIAAAGDVNRDGAGDLLVGIQTDDPDDIPAGVYLVLAADAGEHTWESLAEAGLIQAVALAAAGDELGWAVASADLDGDGIMETAWSAPGEDQGALDGGRVYLRIPN